MASKKSNWDRILQAMNLKTKEGSSTKDYRLEELMSTIRRGKTEASERLEPSEVLMRRCELLYRLDPLIFSGINKMTRRITSSRIYFNGGLDNENERAYEFLEDSNALALLPHLTKDAFIYGFGVAEINREKGEVTLTQIDPKEFDYQREDGTKEIATDKNGDILGYVWNKKSTSTPVKLKPDQVLLIRFYTLGEYCLGISPIETAFKTSWIKLNLEEALGEAIFRHGFPLLKFTIGSSVPGNPYS